jgi:hypothetical protein
MAWARAGETGTGSAMRRDRTADNCGFTQCRDLCQRHERPQRARNGQSPATMLSMPFTALPG